MAEDFTFSPMPRLAPKRRKRSQTAPLIASIVTPAVVMIGFLVYLDQKGFFSPQPTPKVVAAKAEYKPQIDKGGGKHFPDPVRRPPRQPQPLPPNPPGPVADPVMNEADGPIRDDAERPARPPRKVTGNVLASDWEISLPIDRALPREERLHARDLLVSVKEVTGDLAKNEKVWVYLFPGVKEDPCACFPLESKRKEVPGIVPPVWSGTAFIASRLRRPAMAVDYISGKRTGELRVFDDNGSTVCLVRFMNDKRQGVACVCEDGKPVYAEDTRGGQTKSYFLTADGPDLKPIEVNPKDAKEVDRAGDYQRRLLEIVADLEAREKEWRRQFYEWSLACTATIKRRASMGQSPAERQKLADAAIEELRGHEQKLRDDLLGRR